MFLLRLDPLGRSGPNWLLEGASQAAEDPSLPSPALPSLFRERAEYGFGEYGFKHRTQWVFRGSPSSGERAQWVPFSLLFVCKRDLTEFLAGLTEFASELSEFSLLKQYSRNSIPPVPYSSPTPRLFLRCSGRRWPGLAWEGGRGGGGAWGPSKRHLPWSSISWCLGKNKGKRPKI